MTDLTIDSYSKQKLWGIVQEQGRIVGVIAQAVISPNLSDRELRGRLIELLVTIGAITKQDLPSAEPSAILMPDEPEIEIVKA